MLVFQEGVGADLLGFQTADTIEAWVPLFLFSVLFGLSMDYQVFLLSRIRERFDESGDTTDAVTFGVGSTARIITGAALIIVAVFAGFARGDLIMFQQMGFGVAIALLLDATLIRSVLLPSAMKLLGDWNWYLPRWLEWIPRVRIDARVQRRVGTRLLSQVEASDAFNGISRRMTGIDDQTPSVAATELEIEEARRYVRRKRIFYMLLGIWIALSLMWFAIDMLEGGEGTWFYWPMLGTGIAVAITGVVLLGVGGLMGVEWERREINKYLRRRGSEPEP